MKTITLFTLGLFLVVSITLVPFKKAKFEQGSNINSLKPYEHYFLGRDFPVLIPDVAAYKQVLVNETNKNRLFKTSSSALWQMEGPNNIGGRITAIAIHPSSLSTILIGTPNGGIFKSTNDGSSWTPVFDNEITLSIGDIAYAPSNNQIVYAGTGDPALSGYPFIGNGVYKSTDGGNTWVNSGLTNTGVISKIEVHPTNPNIVYAAAMGIPMVRTPDRGIYKSTDGGTSWTKVKFIDNETGFSNIIINPSNPLILYATSWRRIRNNQESITSGYTSRLYKSSDGGTTWNMLTTNLPNIDLSNWHMCMSKQNPDKLYVSLTDSSLKFNSLYVTTNAGVNFTKMAAAGVSDPYGGQGWYVGDLTINPVNDNNMLMGGVDIYKTTDGGANLSLAAPVWSSYVVHADHHDVAWVSSNTYYLCTDGGLYKTTDGGSTYFHYTNLPINQLYHITANPLTSGDYWTGAQDNGTLNGNASVLSAWTREFGGDGFQQRFNSTNALEYFTETQNGNIVATDDGGLTWMNATFNIDPADRRNWDMPYVMSSVNPDVLYTGTYQVYKNTAGVYAFWNSISPDLTDGNIYGDRFHSISSIDHSKLNPNKLLVGTTDANVWYTNDDGGTWNNITSTLPNRYVSSVKWSPNNSNTLYVTHTGYKYNDYLPHIHKSIDNGSSWTDISSNLPQFAINDILVFPGDENQIYVATDGGVYFTLNGGVNWQRLGTNMPLIPVYDIEYEASTKKLLAGTYARSVQSIDLSLLTAGLVNKTNQALELDIFPMPIESEINFKISESFSEASVVIYDLKGQKVYSQQISIIANQLVTLPVHLSSGEYFIQLTDSKNSYTKKIIKI